ncbi:hypothetical protein AN217_03255 [Streptomyces qinglanensis]|uniref:Uncharacterized protein n=1 Tax=Streptomyces qinglanensis TaxID=943816 RepID=A0A1E7KEE4_9ACTN|nr:hypothetical protein AN217_03255 [Streptomyces qinglanensis]OEV27008.1 hypothetical protein AN220_06360 [Streptomyces nanshensis]
MWAQAPGTVDPAASVCFALCRRALARFPQTRIEHQRRLRFLEASRKTQAQVCSEQRLSRAASPVRRSSHQAIASSARAPRVRWGTA